MVATLSTEEYPLRPSVALGRVIATAARLAGVTRIDRYHPLTAFLSLVVEETSQLGKAPTMQAARLLPMLLLHPGAYVCQVFHHYRATGRRVIYNATTKQVVMVTPLPKQFTGELTQVAFCTLCAFGLQFTAQPKDTGFKLSPATLSKEVIVGSDSRTHDAEVNPYHISGNVDVGRGYVNHDVQPKRSFTVDKIGTGNLAQGVLGCVLRYGEGKLHPPGDGGETASQPVPLDPVATNIVTDGAEGSTRLAGLTPLALVRADLTASVAFIRAETTNWLGSSGWAARSG